jgi:hypothetical protein
MILQVLIAMIAGWINPYGQWFGQNQAAIAP